MEITTVTICDSDNRLNPNGYSQKIDLLFCLGDLDNRWLAKALDRIQPSAAFGIRGNHDSDFPFPSGITEVHPTGATWKNLRICGLPGSWKYKPVGYWLYTQEEANTLCNQMGACDILLSHNSPAGIHERDDNVHQGFKGLRSYIQAVQPEYCLHGHQHLSKTSTLGATKIIGVYGEELHQLTFP